MAFKKLMNTSQDFSFSHAHHYILELNSYSFSYKKFKWIKFPNVVFQFVHNLSSWYYEIVKKKKY